MTLFRRAIAMAAEDVGLADPQAPSINIALKPELIIRRSTAPAADAAYGARADGPFASRAS